MRKLMLWFALLLITIGVVIGGLFAFSSTDNRAFLFADPQLGDVYYVDMKQIDAGFFLSRSKNAYTTLQLFRVDGDVFYFFTATVANETKRGLQSAIDTPMESGFRYLDNDLMALTKEQLERYLENDVIYEIHRPG